MDDRGISDKMVLKKSKHDLNTGNTLRNHDLELKGYTRGLVECHVDREKIGEMMNLFFNSLRGYEDLFVLGILEDVLEISSSLEVTCSLSKKSRWSSVEDLLNRLEQLNDLSHTISYLSINVNVVKHLDSMKRHIIPLHSSTIWSKEKETSLRLHDRGIQRCSCAQRHRSDRGKSIKYVQLHYIVNGSL